MRLCQGSEREQSLTVVQCINLTVVFERADGQTLACVFRYVLFLHELMIKFVESQISVNDTVNFNYRSRLTDSKH